MQISNIYNSYEKKLQNWNNFLFINNNDSFQINSSYENFNLISQNKLIKNKILQKKMKDYLLEQIDNSNNTSLKKISSYKSSGNKKSNYNYKKEYQNTEFRKSNFFNDNSIIKASSKINNNDSGNKSPNKKKIINRLSLPQINMEKVKKALSGKDLLETNLKSEINTNNDNNIVNQTLIGFQKSEKSANPIVTSPNLKARKRKGTILHKINNNIQKRNQNLNNPEIFYTNYFNSIIIGELNQKLNSKKERNSYSPPKLK